ncbi:MAG: hypothetical protein ACOX78_08520 [Lachnospiraceae bacterium]
MTGFISTMCDGTVSEELRQFLEDLTMMILPTDEERKMFKQLKVWLRYDVEDGPILRDDAPDEIKKYYKRLLELYKDADKWS